MRRKRSKSVIDRDNETLVHIRNVKSEHPFWGYRRVWAYLRFRQGINVSRNRIARIMSENDLMVKKNHKLKATRTKTRSKPQASLPNQYWGMDMTKILLGSYGWIYLHVVLDWYTKEIVGFNVSWRSRTSDWLDALEKAVNKRFPEGTRKNEHMLNLITDNGCQPTSQAFMRNCAVLNVRQIFTSWCNPKGNADTERVIRTLKEDLVWTRDWDNPFEFEIALNRWIDNYNSDFPHQSLDYLTPNQKFENFFGTKQNLLNLKKPNSINFSLP